MGSLNIKGIYHCYIKDILGTSNAKEKGDGLYIIIKTLFSEGNTKQLQN